jgi:hypothetical protein
MINHKLAEKYRGFLVYVSRTYTSMVPYLKGIHLSLDSWRPDRDEDGWRISNGIERKIACETHEKPKEFVNLATRFKEDMKVLLFFFSRPTPPKLPIRPSGSAAMYMVGDASGSGFGISVWEEGKEEIDTAYGALDDEVQGNSSNYREALNLVIRVETMLAEGSLKEGTELFVFTDNSVSERVFYNGSSRSKTLHQLVVRLRKLEMEGRIFVHFIWISGERMKEQGTDGLSRGELFTGVMAGDDFFTVE